MSATASRISAFPARRRSLPGLKLRAEPRHGLCHGTDPGGRAASVPFVLR